MTPWWNIARTWIAYVVAIVVLVVNAQLHNPALAALGAVVLILAAWGLHRRLRVLRREAWKPFVVISALVAIVGAAMGLVWFTGEQQGLLAFGGIIAMYFGVGQLLGTVRAWPGRPRVFGAAVAGACAVAFTVGLVVLTVEAAPWSVALLGLALLGAPVALTLLTDDALDWLASRGGMARQTAIGAVALAAGLAGLLLLGTPTRYAVITVVVLALMVGAIASATDADIVVVLIAVALVWSFAPREDPAPESAKPARGDRVLVALGDSYISGEGAERYVEGTNTRGKNECRRAPTAYPVSVVERDGTGIPDRVLFLACSGAKARHLHRERQYDDEPDHQIGQLVEQRDALDLDVALVVVSIGGNDALFGTIGRACVGPGDCAELGGFWLDELKPVEGKIDDAYEAIREAIGPDVPVVAVPYPIPLDDDGCARSLLTEQEHRFLHGFTRELNDVVRRAAARAGFHYLAEMEDSLERARLRICDGSPGRIGVNFLAANPVVGVLQQRVSPVNWFHNSLHPNERGHDEMAVVLARWIDDHVGPDEPVEPPDADGGGRVATIAELMGRPGFKHCAELGGGLPSCRSNTSHWTTAHMARFIWYGTLPLVLVAGGAWILWLRVIVRARSRARPS